MTTDPDKVAEAFDALTLATVRLARACMEWGKAKDAYLATDPYGKNSGTDDEH